MAKRVIAIVGPTAAGKSELAVEAGLRLGGEIVNADSMQLYRGMDIGTAKMPVAERRGVPHHLLDVWDVRHTASVAEYQEMARAVIERVDLPILVGGSGLYVRAAIDRLEFPGTDPKLRARLEEELVARGAEAMHARLRSWDPEAAEVILASNGRRIVRALEVIELTGRPFSATLPAYESHYEAVQIGLAVPRDALDERIRRRVEHMWEAGFVEEVRSLAQYGLREGLTASRALGYAQVLRSLDREWTETRAKEETIRATRRFARRQESWFRRDPRIQWVEAGSGDLANILGG